MKPKNKIELERLNNLFAIALIFFSTLIVLLILTEIL